MHRTIILATLILSFVNIAFGADATSAWRDVLQKCAASDLLGRRQVLFFGVSNTVGPGSVWRFSDDKSVRLLFELSDAVPSPDDRANLLVVGPLSQCVGQATSNWNLRFGLPFSTPISALAANIAAILGRAKNVTVSVDSFGMDVLKEVPWRTAFKRLGAADSTNAYYSVLFEDGSVLAENVVKVGGLKAVFTFDRALSADVAASFSGKNFSLGGNKPTAATPAPSSGSGSTTTAGSTGAATTTGGSATTTTTTTTTTATPPATQSTSGGPPITTSSTAHPCSNGATVPTTRSPSESAKVSPAKEATFHAEVTSQNQITLCSEGPFYILAAYSKLVGGKPVGIQDIANAPLGIRPTNAPKGAKVEDGRGSR
jgi:hypothetical protein